MQFPRIHLNGSHGPTLLEQYGEAIFAMNDAIGALRRLDVNGRDYYTISSEAASVAMKEHRARLAALELVWKELTAIAEDIDTQISQRAA